MPIGKRNWSTLSTAEWDEIIQHYESRDQIALTNDAAMLGTTVENLGRQIRSTKLARDKYAAKHLANSVPQSPSPIRDEFKVVHDEDAIIISDIEVPDYSQFMFKAALLTGMRYGIRRVIWAGDLIATDQDALNTWLTVWRDEESRSFYGDCRS